MRTTEEIRNEILKRSKEVKTKRKKIIYSSIPLCFCCIIIILGVTLTLQRNSLMSNNMPTIFGDETKTNSTQTEVLSSTQEITSNEEHSEPLTNKHNTPTNKFKVKLFSNSNKNPDTDSFGEDELAHVDIVIDSNKSYRQLSINEYAKYGLKTELNKKDIGALIGTVIETKGISQKNIKVSSQDPNLKNCSVYHYAPMNNDALLIVMNDNNCSIFVFDQFVDNINHSITEIYDIFGVKSANDISYLTYTISGTKNSHYQVIAKGKVTNKSKIETFYSITSSLVPFTSPSSISATPDWVNEAYDEYRKNPEKYKQEDIAVDVHLKNGLIIPQICSYQPYIADGYVDNMERLTPEQNKLLREVFNED